MVCQSRSEENTNKAFHSAHPEYAPWSWRINTFLNDSKCINVSQIPGGSLNRWELQLVWKDGKISEQQKHDKWVPRGLAEMAVSFRETPVWKSRGEGQTFSWSITLVNALVLTQLVSQSMLGRGEGSGRVIERERYGERERERCQVTYCEVSLAWVRQSKVAYFQCSCDSQGVHPQWRMPTYLSLVPPRYVFFLQPLPSHNCRSSTLLSCHWMSVYLSVVSLIMNTRNDILKKKKKEEEGEVCLSVNVSTVILRYTGLPAAEIYLVP